MEKICDGKCNAIKNGWVYYCGEGVFACTEFDSTTFKCKARSKR